MDPYRCNVLLNASKMHKSVNYSSLHRNSGAGVVWGTETTKHDIK